ncbi:HK97-gp10 family putative phage morphogenesis protein [Xanthomonas sp. MUS 060]|uniref:HK97-gp10 family putative phage morphogenesis protein n=1 Tax=Xanthomonas sp. MUS 060 TaxID=1588031 RepID=UPI0005F2FE90|nr:HK97-gp10 family putative phage morphogenesis protein [Xanthomonas sp. MUS 060]
MKQFGSLAAFATQLTVLEAGVVFQLEKGLDAVAAKIEKTAKEEIGEYQEAIGPFPAWEELADSTKEDRIYKGYTENDPLLRSGELRDSISHETKGLEAAIGSDSDIAVYQEMGTETIPPRPFLGPAVEYNHESIRKIVGGALVVGLLGGGSIPAELEYDHEI